MLKQNQHVIFTDGAARGNPGRGGWGAIIATEDLVWELGGAEKHTTNNRMELLAVLSAIKFAIAKKISTTVLYTDSGYVLNGATKWLTNWKKNDWQRKESNGQMVAIANQKLWMELDELLPQIKIEWQQLLGHQGFAGNERCDQIATAMADENISPLYEGKRKNYPVDLIVDEQQILTAQQNHQQTKTKTGKAYSYVAKVGAELKVFKQWSDCANFVKGKPSPQFRKVFSATEEAELLTKWR